MNEIMLSNNVFSPELVEKVFSSLDISIKTKTDYLYRLNRFKEFVYKSPNGFDRNTLLDYKRDIQNDGLIKVSTKNKFLVVAKIYTSQLFRLGITKIDLSQGVKCFKLSQGFKTSGFSDDEINRILQGLSKTTDLRLQSILSLKLFAGLRDIELTRLLVEDINLEEGIIMVHGKSRDSKESLPIVTQVLTVLRKYLDSTGKRSGSLFTSKRTVKGSKPLTTKTVWLQVRNFLDGLGISKNPHTARGWFCTELVKGMSNLFEVIQYSRHSSIQTLQNYVNQVKKLETVPKFKSVFKDFTIQPEIR